MRTPNMNSANFVTRRQWKGHHVVTLWQSMLTLMCSVLFRCRVNFVHCLVPWLRSVFQKPIWAYFLLHFARRALLAPAGPTVMLARGITAPFRVVPRLKSVDFTKRLNANTLLGSCSRLSQAFSPCYTLHRQRHLIGCLTAGYLTGQPRTEGRRALPVLRSPTLQCR